MDNCVIETKVNGITLTFPAAKCSFCGTKVSPPAALQSHVDYHLKQEWLTLVCRQCNEPFLIQNPSNHAHENYLIAKICPGCRGKKSIGNHRKTNG